MTDELNEIIKSLYGWIADTKFIVREISFYTRPSGVYVYINLGKSVNGKTIAIKREFYLGGVCYFQLWEAYMNNIELETMLEELKDAKLEDLETISDENA